MRWLDEFWRDSLYAIRTLRRNSGFATIALLSIALSVGASAVVFAAVKSVLINPLPYTRPQELVQVATDFVNADRSQGDWVFWNDVQELIRRTRTLQSIGIYRNAVFDLAGDAPNLPQAMYGLRISASLFSTLGVSPILGRNILPEETRPGHANVMILSHGLWTRRFHADPNIIGQFVTINGRRCRIIGVMGPGFNFPLRREAARTPFPYVEFWAPLQLDPAARLDGALGMVARLRPGVTLPQAQADLASISAALAREFPVSNRDRTHRMAFLWGRTVRTAQTSLWLLMAASLLFLFIGCANVANLLLARGFARRHEMAVRTAVGAGTGRIVRQLLTESCVLAVLGGAGGFLLAAAAWEILPALTPVSIPRLSAARADSGVLFFALAVALLNGVLFGLGPAIRAAGWRPAAGGRDLSVRGAAAGRQDRMRASLVIAEVAITVMLVVLGGHFVGNFVRLLFTDPGFTPDGVFASVVLPAPERYPTPEQHALVYRRFLEAVRSLPGVQSAGTVDALPFSGENHGGVISAHPSAPFDPRYQLVAEVNIVGGDYLQTMGVRLAEGRWFRSEEANPSNQAVIVDQALAQRLWPGSSALGQRLCVHCAPERPDNWKRVIGVVSGMRHSSLEGIAHHNVYLSGGAMEHAAFLVVRTNRDAAGIDNAVRAAIAAVDPNQPVLIGASMRSFLSDSIADRRFVTTLFAITGWLALLMAAAGVYGVTAYTTSRRTQEIGIRMALGATPGGVHRLLFRDALQVVAVGLALGLASALAALRLISGRMQGFDSPEPELFAIAAALVIAATAIASWVPARRATTIDPVAALRQE